MVMGVRVNPYPGFGDNPSAYSTCRFRLTQRGKEYGILFIFCLFCEYIPLEYVRVPVISRVNQAEYVVHIREVAPQEYVNIYSTRRDTNPRRGEVCGTNGMIYICARIDVDMDVI